MDKIELMGVECSDCKTYYFTKAETGVTTCPKCKKEIEIFHVKGDFDEQQSKMISNIFNDLYDFFEKVGIDKQVPKKLTLDFVVDVVNKVTNMEEKQKC